jgi:hypothetical protein
VAARCRLECAVGPIGGSQACLRRNESAAVREVLVGTDARDGKRIAGLSADIGVGTGTAAAAGLDQWARSRVDVPSEAFAPQHPDLPFVAGAQPPAPVGAGAIGAGRSALDVREVPFDRIVDGLVRQVVPPDGAEPVGHDRRLGYGVTIARPLSSVNTFLTNVWERTTGERDDRSGPASLQIALAGERLLRAGLRARALQNDAIGRGSSFLAKAVPVTGIAIGLTQVWKGWHELEHKSSPLDVLGSKAARTGLLVTAASATWFVGGVGGALAGAVFRFAAAANELDAFARFDQPTVSIEQRGDRKARIAHPLDPTPTVRHDAMAEGLDERIRLREERRAAEDREGADPLGHALLWLRDRFEG